MIEYQLKACRDPSQVFALTIEAVDERDAVLQAEAQGLTVLATRVVRTRNLPWLRRSTFRLAMFNQELLSLVEAGLTLVEAVETLAEKEARAEAKKILQAIVAQLFEGRSLSHALEAQPAVFPPLYVATVRASEKTGALAEALRRYIVYQERAEVVSKKVVNASIYPVLLMVAGTLVTLFLLVYVVPRFSRLYQDLGSDLPLLSRLLLQWGQSLQSHGGAIAVAGILLLCGMVYGITRPATRAWVLRTAWRIPAVGERLRIYQLARFYHTLGMLLRGGMSVAQSLRMVAELLPPALRESLAQAGKTISEGRNISFAMEQHQLATPVAVRMLRVGEKTGQMGQMMERIAGFYDDEMARWIEWFTRLFEPLLMAAIGVIIGGIVVLMYLPIFELAGSLK
jgi:general secretion pathway protein F